MGLRVVVACALLAFVSPQQAEALTGGTEAPTSEYPWMAALLDGQGKTPQSAAFCGGVLIHPSWVLTAAHCVLERRATDFEVAFGLQTLDGSPTSGVRRRVAEMIIHPRYLFRNQQQDGDLALLRLASPVDIQPVRILERDPDPEAPAHVIGWTEDSQRGLAELPMDLLERLEAQQATGEGFFLDALPVYSGSATTGICYGDSGGPLLAFEDGEPRLCGTASYVVGRCTGYAVYTNLQDFRPWILSQVYPGFDVWRGIHGIEALWEDADADGYDNFLEYARLSDPRNASQTEGFVTAAVQDGRPVLQFAHRNQVDYAIDISEDLKSWSPVAPPEIISSEPLGEEGESLTVGSPLDLETHPRQFLRTRSFPRPKPTLPGRATGREVYVKGDADLLVDSETGQFEHRFLAQGLVTGLTRFEYTAPFFAPKVRWLDQATGELVGEFGEGGAIVTGDVPTEAGTWYEVVLTSVEAEATGYYTFNYPPLLNALTFLELDRQPVQSVLNESSDLQGNFFTKAYQILGGFTGETINVTLTSDPDQGGFRPYVAVVNSAGETVAQTAGSPETSTSVTFEIGAGENYFAFATTLLERDVGLFSLSANRAP